MVRRGQLLTPGAAERFDHELDAARSMRRAEKAAESFREGRRMSAAQLREARSSGVVSAARPLVSGDACRRCRVVRGKRFPIETCTVEMLPPYQDCEHETGCESCWTEVLDSKKPRGAPKIRMAVRRRVSRRFVALALLVVGLLAYLLTR